jgi:hypothetical protein
MLESAPRLFVNGSNLKPSVQRLQEKNEPSGKLFILSSNSVDIWGRITEAFKTDKVQKIADKVGLSYQAVRKWKVGEPIGLDNLIAIKNLTHRSIDWILTGEEPKIILPAPEPVGVEKLLKENSLPDIFKQLFDRLDKLEAIQSIPQDTRTERTLDIPYLAQKLGVSQDAILRAKDNDPVLFKRMQEVAGENEPSNGIKHRR